MDLRSAVNTTDQIGTTRQQVRGSSLLLFGRVLSVAVKLLAQTLIVRHLATSDYGAWAYAVSVVALLIGFASLSFDQSVARFASMYREQNRYGDLVGALLLSVVTVLVVSLLVTVPVLAAPGWVGRITGTDRTIVSVLTALIVTVPLGALDRLLAAVFATFGRARTIFLRRYVLAPSLQLAVVVLFVIRHASLTALAYGFVLGEVVGLVLYAAALGRLFREAGLLTHFSLRRIRMPVRDLFAFSIPLATGDWLAAFVQSSGVLVLAYVYTTHHVALFRAVLPVALLNESVLLSFSLLFLPAASRLFAIGDVEGLNLFYWRTTVWIAVMSFPVFAATFALATPLSVMFFGSRYAASGHLLHILALGIYLQAVLGFNGNMLKVAGFVRSLMLINLAALAINAGLILLLVPRYGAIGAAWAMTGSLALHNLLKQVRLRGVPGLRAADARFALPFIVLLGAVLALALLRWTAPHSLFVLLPGACAITLAVVILTRRDLRIGDVFPELRRLAILRPLLA